MQLSVFSVLDAKAEIFSQPMLSVNRATMMRLLTDVLGDPNHNYAKHPEDFVLYELGSFDDQRGTFDLLATPMSVCCLRDLRVLPG